MDELGASIETALWAVETAKKQATSGLPRSVKSQHWVKQKTSPVPWREVAMWYWRSDSYEVRTGHVLDALVILSQCQELLTGFLKEKPCDTVPDLTLPKVRRSS